MITDFAALEECNKTRESAIRALRLAIHNLNTPSSPGTRATNIALATELVSAAQECKDRYGDEYPYEHPEQKQELDDLLHQLLTMLHKHKAQQ